jgi:hypothetical protein
MSALDSTLASAIEKLTDARNRLRRGLSIDRVLETADEVSIALADVVIGEMPDVHRGVHTALRAANKKRTKR